MRKTWLVLTLVYSFLLVTGQAKAQGTASTTMPPAVIEDFKESLGLTPQQMDAVASILKRYQDQQTKLAQENKQEGDSASPRLGTGLRELDQQKIEDLRKILTPSQMEKWEEIQESKITLPPELLESLKNDLKLTAQQLDVVAPIVARYNRLRSKFYQENSSKASEAVPPSKEFKAQWDAFSEKESAELSKALTPEQMATWNPSK